MADQQTTPETATTTDAPASGTGSVISDKLAEAIADFAGAESSPRDDELTPAAEAAAAAASSKTAAGKQDQPPAQEPPASEQADEGPNDLELPEDLQALVQAGDVVGALKALGFQSPEKVANKHWVDFRQQKKDWTAQRDRERSEIEAAHAQVDQHADGILKEFKPFKDAREAFDNGDFAGALKLAFDIDPDDFSEKWVKQKTSTDPEAHRRLQKLEREREAERKAAEERASQEAAAKQAQVQEENTRKHWTKIVGELSETHEPLLQKAKELNLGIELLRTITNVQLAELRQTGEEITAQEALSRIVKNHQNWTSVLTINPDQSGTSEHPDQDGSPPAPSRRQPARPAMSHARARRAGGKPIETYRQSRDLRASELAKFLG